MKKNIVIVVLLVMCVTFGFLAFSNEKETILEEDDVPRATHKEMLSMMLETDSGSGEYSLETRNSWPTKEDGYIFNSTLSKCERGSQLRWDEENNMVVMVGTTSDLRFYWLIGLNHNIQEPKEKIIFTIMIQH